MLVSNKISIKTSTKTNASKYSKLILTIIHGNYVIKMKKCVPLGLP